MGQRKWIEITVGLFVVAGIASLLMLALKVSNLNTSYEEGKGYPLSLMFNNAGGLKPKAKVTIAGVPVGRVRTIELNHDFVAKVVVWMHQEIQLPDDTKASILTAGLLGDNYIGLTPGFSETALKSGAMIPETQTDSAMVLEDLISKFVSSKASEPVASSKVNEKPNESNSAGQAEPVHHL